MYKYNKTVQSMVSKNICILTRINAYGAHLQCVNNHYGKFEYKGIKSVLITDYTQIKKM